MEPVTHMLYGACLARGLGLNRRARYATAAMAIAAEIPDIDYIHSVAGPLSYFRHHRGWTHSFLWMPAMAALTVAIIYAWHRWKSRKNRPAPSGAPPLRWAYLFSISFIALCSHLFLDWTNNYGIRPFAPFNPRWYQGELVFVVEPVFLLILGLALGLTPLFRLTDREIGARDPLRRGQGLAIAGLLIVATLWGLRWYEHGRAMDIAAEQEMLDNAPILRITMSPLPFNPWRWAAIIETPSFYQVGTVDTHTGTMTRTAQDIFWKGPITPAVIAAEKSELGQVYLDWSRFPLIDDMGIVDNDPDYAGLRAVRFRDARFLYDVLSYHGREKAPLQATAYLDAQNRIVHIAMHGPDARDH